MATYYVRASGGDDAAAGTSFGAAWATIQYGFDTVAAGDNLLICADGTHAPTSTIDVDTTSGTNTAYINVYGANALGVVDGTQAVIDGSGITTADCIAISGGHDRYRFANLRVTGGTADCFSGAAGSVNVYLFNCQFDGATTYGIDWAGGSLVIDSCELNLNGSHGALLLGTNNRILNSSFHDNTNTGAYFGGGTPVAESSLFYDNGLDGLRLDSLSLAVVRGNVLNGNTGDGLYLNAVLDTGTIRISDNILSNNGAYGLSVNGTPDGFGLCDYNWFYNNTSGDADIDDSFLGANTTTGVDPQFISIADGAENFRLEQTSPCWGAGFGGPSA